MEGSKKFLYSTSNFPASSYVTPHPCMIKRSHLRRLGRKRWKVRNQNARIAEVSQGTHLDDDFRGRTELRVGEKPERTSRCTALNEAQDVDPKLHVVRSGSSILVEQEGQEDSRIWLTAGPVSRVTC